MKIFIAIPLKNKTCPLVAEGQKYLDRMRKISVKPLFLTKSKAIFEKSLEQELLKQTAGCFRIALTDSGRKFNSELFVTYLEQLMGHKQNVAFIIGGAFGLSSELVSSCDATLSVSSFTLPHRLAFLLLCEQLYRAGEIMCGTPYHK